MRLGLDLLFLIPDETGGRETYARELIAAIWDLEPSLAATAFVNREAGPRLAQELGANMRVVRLPVSARRPEQWALGELALLPGAAARAGVQLLHSPANFAPVAGPFRRVVTLHDLQYRAVPELLTPARRRGTAALLEPAAQRAHRIIAVSHAARDELVGTLHLDPERIDVIPNGIGARYLDPAMGEDEVRARSQLGQRAVVLAVASDLPHKNLAGLIDALALIAPERRPVLVIAGPGTDGPHLRARVAQAEVSDDVRLLGFCPPDELAGLYGMVHAFVLPSLYEGFGLPVLEAMARGTPVACSDIPALREVAGDAAVLFNPHSAADIAAAVQRITTDVALAARTAAAGRRRADHFSWHRTAAQTMRTYYRALREPRDDASARLRTLP